MDKISRIFSAIFISVESLNLRKAFSDNSVTVVADDSMTL